ncbi:hypothetical protein D3C72_2256160 [compost metagenome]
MAAFHFGMFFWQQTVVPFGDNRAGRIKTADLGHQAGHMPLEAVPSVHPAHFVLQAPENDRRMVFVALHKPPHMLTAILHKSGMVRQHGFA